MPLASRRSTKNTTLLAALCCFALIPDAASAQYYYGEEETDEVGLGLALGKLFSAIISGITLICCIIKCLKWDGEHVAGTVAPNPDIENPSPVFVKAVARKDSASSNVGITFTKKGDKVAISQIDADSIFADKGLTFGMTVLSINGVSCPPYLREAIALVRQAEGDLSILALSIPNQSSS